MNSIIDIPAPSSKSLSHRALIAAGLASGVSRLERVLESDDTTVTRNIMSALGATYEPAGPGSYIVTGTAGRVWSGGDGRTPLDIFVGESGTSCRLLTAIVAAGEGAFRIHGSGRMHERPLGELAAVLSSLGADITFENKPDCPPLLIRAHGLAGSCPPPEAEGSGSGVAVIGCDESSQYISGLLLAAPLGCRGMTVLLGGERAVSWPYVGLTLDVMAGFGITFCVQKLEDNRWNEIDWRLEREAEPGKLRFCVNAGTYDARKYAVEGDWSGASYFLAAGAIGPVAVRLSGINVNSLQGDASIIGILKNMGARLEMSGDSVTVFPSPLRGLDVDMGHCPDLVPTVAALAAHADGPTRIYNVAHLKIKESDRIAAPAKELSKAGCEVHATDDGLIVVPSVGGPRAPEKDVLFSAHNDHRMAMSLSLLGLAGRRGRGFAVRLDNPGCVAKSFPDFWRLWEKVIA